MTDEHLNRILAGVASAARVAVLGDVCLDTYYFLSSDSERSIETGLQTQIVERAHTYLGGAANVAANCAALGAAEVALYGVIGDDMYGRELSHLCARQGIDARGLVVQPELWSTNVYTKPYRDGVEQSRIDLGTLNRLQPETAAKLIEQLRHELPRFHAVIINQQLVNGIHTPRFRTALAELVSAVPTVPVFLDSRDYPDEYPGTVRKLNLDEARRLLAEQVVPRPPDSALAEVRSPPRPGTEEIDAAKRLSARWDAPVCITHGEAGCVTAEGQSVEAFPAVAVGGPIDTVGAGDSLLAGLAAVRAGGFPYRDAVQVGLLAAGVTIGKRFRTGTASPDELRALNRDCDYIHNPELARAPRCAEYLDRSQIEIVNRPTPPAPAAPPQLRYAIFDHDGTISTIREGWEQIMEPMMCEAVLGGRLEDLHPDELEPVRRRVRELIDRTTGYQTIIQMQLLRELVREFGYVEEPSIKTAEEYKALYNRELLELADRRVSAFRRGELGVGDLTVKGAVALLEALRDAGIVLYLASGTDHDDLVREADQLGYAGLFGGGIAGSVGDAENDPKRVVLRRILAEIGSDRAGTLVTFGDGPVEIRETRKLGGFAIGVASDEVRRYGLNVKKRERLIRAGAQLIVPDYSQADRLLRFLNVNGERS